MVNPNQLNQSAEQAPAAETVRLILERVQQPDFDWRSLIEGVALDPDSNEVEDIYPIDNFVETNDDMAVVIYKGIEEPHKHTGGETEAHVGLEGIAAYFISGESEPMRMGRGSSYIISPETPHFAAAKSNEPFVALVISSPTFNPDNQKPLSADIPTEAAILSRYNHLIHNLD